METTDSLVTITLYKPDAAPEQLPASEFTKDLVHGGVLPVDRVASLLGCHPSLVDTLASGPNYVAYSIFDAEDDLNPAAMKAVAIVTGVPFDNDDEDSSLCGAILIVTL